MLAKPVPFDVKFHVTIAEGMMPAIVTFQVFVSPQKKYSEANIVMTDITIARR